MIGQKWKWLVAGMIVAVSLLAWTTDANAFWGCHRGGWSGCYSACYSPCYYGCYTPCYSSCYNFCGYGCYSGCGWGYSAYYAPTYAYVGYSAPCCTGGVVVESSITTSTPAMTPTPAQKPAAPAMPAPAEAPAVPPVPAAPAPSPNAGTSMPTPAESGLLTVYVPAEAKVLINGRETKTTGTKRQYVSYGLKSGYSYNYTVQVSLIREGKTVETTRTVTLTAGGRESVAFELNPYSAEGLATNP